MSSLASLEVLHAVLLAILQSTGPVNATPSELFPHVIPSVVNQTNLSDLIGFPMESLPISRVAPSIQYDQQLAEPSLTVLKSAAKHLISSSLTSPSVKLPSPSSEATFSPTVLKNG